MSEYVSGQLRRKVQERARRRCEYCLCPLDISTEAFAVDHVFPTVRGGKTDLSNPALACSGCNTSKYDRIDALDPLTDQSVPLFNPRTQSWYDHFVWNEDYTEVIGLTSVGRASVIALRLNRLGVINLRRALFVAGLHPPSLET